MRRNDKDTVKISASMARILFPYQTVNEFAMQSNETAGDYTVFF